MPPWDEAAAPRCIWIRKLCPPCPLLRDAASGTAFKSCLADMMNNVVEVVRRHSWKYFCSLFNFLLRPMTVAFDCSDNLGSREKAAVVQSLCAPLPPKKRHKKKVKSCRMLPFHITCVIEFLQSLFHIPLPVQTHIFCIACSTCGFSVRPGDGQHQSCGISATFDFLLALVSKTSSKKLWTNDKSTKTQKERQDKQVRDRWILFAGRWPCSDSWHTHPAPATAPGRAPGPFGGEGLLEGILSSKVTAFCQKLPKHQLALDYALHRMSLWHQF